MASTSNGLVFLRMAVDCHSICHEAGDMRASKIVMIGGRRAYVKNNDDDRDVTHLRLNEKNFTKMCLSHFSFQFSSLRFMQTYIKNKKETCSLFLPHSEFLPEVDSF